MKTEFKLVRMIFRKGKATQITEHFGTLTEMISQLVKYSKQYLKQNYTKAIVYLPDVDSELLDKLPNTIWNEESTESEFIFENRRVVMWVQEKEKDNE